MWLNLFFAPSCCTTVWLVSRPSASGRNVIMLWTFPPWISGSVSSCSEREICSWKLIFIPGSFRLNRVRKLQNLSGIYNLNLISLDDDHLLQYRLLSQKGRCRFFSWGSIRTSAEESRSVFAELCLLGVSVFWSLSHSGCLSDLLDFLWQTNILDPSAGWWSHTGLNCVIGCSSISLFLSSFWMIQLEKKMIETERFRNKII